MRLFVAVDLSPETRAEVGDVQEKLEVALSNGRRLPRINWVNPEAAHVTLQFLGETPEPHLTRIINTLGAQRLADRPFEVTWGVLGTFPDARKPRVLWVGATTEAHQLSALALIVRERLTAVGVEDDARAFRAHVTIARVKDPGVAVNWTRVLSAVQITPTVTRVDHVTLYHSQLSPKGSRYTAIATFQL